LEEKRKLKDETYRFLEWQKDQQDQALSKEKELKELENRRLKEQREKDIQQEHLEKVRAFEINKMVYRDIEEFNKHEEHERQKKLFIEKHKDKELINSIVEKEKALDEIDRKEKVYYIYIGKKS
jgi:hypothetical protein